MNTLDTPSNEPLKKRLTQRLARLQEIDALEQTQSDRRARACTIIRFILTDLRIHTADKELATLIGELEETFQCCLFPYDQSRKRSS